MLIIKGFSASVAEAASLTKCQSLGFFIIILAKHHWELLSEVVAMASSVKLQVGYELATSQF